MAQKNTQILKPTVQLFAPSSTIPMAQQQRDSMTGQFTVAMHNAVGMGSVLTSVKETPLVKR